MDPLLEFQQHLTRRHFLGATGVGMGSLAMAGLLGDSMAVADTTSHFTPRAKRIIYIHLAGSPPQHDLLDPKPVLKELDGKPCPDSIFEKERFAFIKGHPKVLASPYEFKQHGESGTEFSELLPNLSSVADDLTVIRSMHTDEFNHAPAQLFLLTGSPRFGRPSVGSWLTWGLGSEASNLPGFVVLVSGGKAPSAGKSAWGSGFLPSVHQGVQCRNGPDPVLYLNDPHGMDRDMRRLSLDALKDLNEAALASHGDPETRTRIDQFELAFKMQMSVPDVVDLGQESATTLEMYGAKPGGSSFANNCLQARRLAERGVRFVQLFDWGWDTHGTGPHDDIVTQLPLKCRQVDQPIAALIKDLKQRGMLEDTLVVVSGEFGRTAMNEERNGSKFLGRDHHPHCFSIIMAGGGMKPGHVHGRTDDMGYAVVENPVHVHDLQATVLHAMGLDHERFTYRYQGREFRLTDVHGRVVHDLFA
ncbi:MAG: sulfatase [Phycisphaerae bacterium]|nr:sulfatase [Phycisphaerae bacterium]